MLLHSHLWVSAHLLPIPFSSQVTATQRSPTNTITIPRQTGRGSPEAKITWLTVATSGIGGQVVLNDKGKGQKTTE